MFMYLFYSSNDCRCDSDPIWLSLNNRWSDYQTTNSPGKCVWYSNNLMPNQMWAKRGLVHTTANDITVDLNVVSCPLFVWHGCRKHIDNLLCWKLATYLYTLRYTTGHECTSSTSPQWMASPWPKIPCSHILLFLYRLLVGGVAHYCMTAARAILWSATISEP